MLTRCLALMGMILLSSTTNAARAAAPNAPRGPNVVVIFADDLGYGDLGCYGAEQWETPHLDRMAAEGMRLTDFYVAQAVCGASRAALLTGCYPNRIGMLGAPDHRARHGIHPDEQLLPELLKAQGYATAAYGKWHLGHHQASLPLQHGFDDYFGLPYSNDMWPRHPTAGANYPPLPLLEGNRTAAVNPDQSQLTTWYTERAVQFIRQHKDQPFFVYLAHSMPHVPLFVSDKFRGHSRQGLYGDVVEEIDWSVGEILRVLRELRVDQNTLVLFTSDNGPWLSYGNHAGSAGPLREGKGTTWEGGVRVPCVIRWPGHVPAGTVSQELMSTLDLLPTFCQLTGAALPQRPIDGLDVSAAWLAAGGRSPRDTFYYYWGNELQAVRWQQWKLHVPHGYQTLVAAAGRDGQPAGYGAARCERALYHLGDDIGERMNVMDQHPQVAERLEKLLASARHQLGDSLTQENGTERRVPARLDQ